MRYDDAEKKLLISCREFVATARRGISASLPYDSDEPEQTELHVPCKKGTQTARELVYDFSIDGQTAQIKTRPLFITENEIQVYATVDSCPKRPKKEPSRR